MTREEVLNLILHRSGMGEEGDSSSPYPYSRPVAMGGEFNVPLASTVSGVAAQSYGGRGLGGGFPFLPLPSFGNLSPENQEEYAYQTETEPEYATVSEAEFERSRAAEGALAPEGVLVPEGALAPEGVFDPEGALAPEGIKNGYRQLTVDSQLQTATEGLEARGKAAVEEMKKQGEILRGERLSEEQMDSAQEVAVYNGLGRFSNIAQIENVVRAQNPDANASEVKAKSEEIARKLAGSAEPITEKDVEIKRDVLQTTPNFSGFRIPSTTVDTVSSAAPVYKGAYSKQKELQPETQQNKGFVSKALDWLSRPESATEITSAAFGLGFIGNAAASALPAFGGNSALGSAFGLGGDSVSRVMMEQAQPIDFSPMTKSSITFNPVKWNAETRSVETIPNTAPKVTTPVFTPSVPSGLQTAAQNVVNKLNQIRTNTNKLTTKEKRLGEL